MLLLVVGSIYDPTFPIMKTSILNTGAYIHKLCHVEVNVLVPIGFSPPPLLCTMLTSIFVTMVTKTTFIANFIVSNLVLMVDI